MNWRTGMEGNSLLTVRATILIVALWLAVICIIINLDIGGLWKLGSNTDT